MEVLTILKKNLIEYCTKYGPFLIDDSGITLVDNIDFNSYEHLMNDEFLEIFCVYLEIISSLAINSNLSNYNKINKIILQILVTLDKLLNENFISNRNFLEIFKFIFYFVFSKDLKKHLDENINYPIDKTKSYKLLDFIKEALYRLNKDHENKKLYDNYSKILNKANILITYLYNNTIFYHKIIRQENLDLVKHHKESSNYWIESINKYIKFLYLFTNPKSGILYEYILNFSNFVLPSVGHKNSTIQVDPTLKIKNASKSNKSGNIPFNFYLTKTILNLQVSIFQFSNK